MIVSAMGRIASARVQIKPSLNFDVNGASRLTVSSNLPRHVWMCALSSLERSETESCTILLEKMKCARVKEVSSLDEGLEYEVL